MTGVQTCALPIFDDRRFAGPVLAQKSQNLPLFDLKVQILID